MSYTATKNGKTGLLVTESAEIAENSQYHNLVNVCH